MVTGYPPGTHAGGVHRRPGRERRGRSSRRSRRREARSSPSTTPRASPFASSASGCATCWPWSARRRARPRPPGRAASDFYCPGALLRVTTAPHPLAAGLDASAAIWFEDSPAFEVERGNVVARYPEENPLLRAGCSASEALFGKAALVEAPLGRGRVVLFGFRPQYRAQSWATYPALAQRDLHLRGHLRVTRAREARAQAGGCRWQTDLATTSYLLTVSIDCPLLRKDPQRVEPPRQRDERPARTPLRAPHARGPSSPGGRRVTSAASMAVVPAAPARIAAKARAALSRATAITSSSTSGRRPRAQIGDGGAQVVVDEAVHGRVFERPRDEARGAQVDVAHAGSDAMRVREQPQQAGAQAEAQPRGRSAELLARGQDGEEEPAGEEAAHRGGRVAPGGGRSEAAGVAPGQLHVFVEALRRRA